MNNAKSFQPTPIIFTLGTLIGLAFGLLIGWVLWPVEWEGATLQELDAAGKAEYIAAVADAFVIYDSPEAAAIAQQRLSSLQTELDSEFVNAMRYFQSSAQPERAIRISNIGRLANSLGMVPPDLQGVVAAPPLTIDDSANQATTAGVDTAFSDTSGDVATAPATSSSTSWFRWFLWLLAALLLIGGGFYLLSAASMFDWQQWLNSRMAALKKRTTVDEFDDYSQPAGEQAGRSGEERNTFVAESEDLAFESEEEEIGRWHYDPSSATIVADEDWADEEGDEFVEDDFDRFSPQRRNPAHFTAESFQSEPIERDNTDAWVDPSSDDDTDLDDGVVPTIDSVMASMTNRPTASTPFEHSADEEINDGFDDDFEDDFEDDDFGEDDFDDPRTTNTQSSEEEAQRTSFSQSDADAIRNRIQEPSQPSVAPPIHPSEAPIQRDRSSNITPASNAKPASSATRHKLIDQHTLHYQMGISEYDESKPIVDPTSGKYIGEFGMGASSKNGVIQANGDYIAALEVWLFDKSDEKNMGNQTRILLSEYAIDHNLEQTFVKERQNNPRPFTPQTGVHFQLESQNLLLNCTIIDVHYLESGESKGMFQSVKVDMSVHQKS